MKNRHALGFTARNEYQERQTRRFTIIVLTAFVLTTGLCILMAVIS